MDNLPVPYDPEILSQLETYEDYLSLYIQLEQATTGFSWMKADLLRQMVDKLGDRSIEELAKDLRQPRSTIINYTRTARAFPPEKRDPAASFSTHFQASFADSYDDKEKRFKSDKRFQWVEKAVDDQLSTRQLAAEIQEEKQQNAPTSGDNRQNLREAEEKVQNIKNLLDSLLVKVKNGNEAAFERIISIFETVFR